MTGILLYYVKRITLHVKSKLINRLARYANLYTGYKTGINLVSRTLTKSEKKTLPSESKLGSGPDGLWLYWPESREFV